MKLSVVMPVYNGGEELRVCLQAVMGSTRPPDEVVVVDDGSTDDSAAVAAACGALVLQLDGPPQGPARARNLAVALCIGDVLVFVDADVAVHADTLQRIEDCLLENNEVAAVFGSYDEAPPAPGLVSRYKNLMHHYVHQHGHREASTFWSGCGALRRGALLHAGGFPEHYREPSIEDIELGMRLRRLGYRIWLCPEIQATHLKRWTLWSMLRSDVRNRALPWGRLIVQGGSLPNDLNLNMRSRASALLAWMAVLCLVVGLVAPWAWLGMVVSLAILAAMNGGLYRFMARHGGLRLALAAAGLHFVYLLYSSAALAYCVIERVWRRRPGD
jgi:glycosyltransferase involved in cell wall biosynthesis